MLYSDRLTDDKGVDSAGGLYKKSALFKWQNIVESGGSTTALPFAVALSPSRNVQALMCSALLLALDIEI